MLKIILTLLLAFVSNSVMAELNDCSRGGTILAQCAANWERLRQDNFAMRSTDDAWYIASFQGFIDGVMSQTFKKAWCINDRTSTDQFYAVVSKYLRDNPEKWNKQSADLVLISIGKAFPCNHPTNTKEKP